MSMFKRITATLSSSIEQVVGEIENHEAVIQATVNDMQKKIVEAKIRLRNACTQEQAMKQKINEQQKQIEVWHKRAIECSEVDGDKALQCVSRARDYLQDKEKLNLILQQYTTTVDKLGQDIKVSEQKLMEMKQKHALMQARQSTSQALNASKNVDSNCDGDLQAPFDRWEMDIGRTEMNVETVVSPDLIEEEFIAHEQRQSLQQGLNELLKKGGK